MTYRAPLAEIEFILSRIIAADRLAETERFAEATAETRAAILEEAGRMVENAIAPLQRAGDLHPARLENGVVRTSPGFAEGFRAIAEGGWVGISADPEHGGMGLPFTLGTVVNEMTAAACLSLSLCPLLTQGQIEALEHHASDDLKALYLPKLIDGTWTGTMNLTEPQAGSDVGALRTRAEPNDDGTFAITGQKIFITWGDNDFAENVSHLVLARLPEASKGTRGLSLFLVPKLIPDEAGKPGVRNALKVVSLEHKLGIHGSPTAVLAFEGATGWIVGEPGDGMAAMFTMMNNARLGVAAEGLGIAEAATQMALAYAAERKQGRTPVEGSGAIIDHADVRRMLLRMKTLTFTARAICLDTALSTDMARAAPEAERAGWKARAAFLTPIAKAFSTDIGNEVANLNIQVHGGMGFIEETGAAQFARDARITPIYEGTNGVQAMDLVGRKLSDGGAAAHALLAEIEAGAKASGDSELARRVLAAHAEVARATDWMLNAPEINDRFAGAAPYLRAWALLLGGWHFLKAAEDPGHAPLAAFHIRQAMAEIPGLLVAATEGAAPLYALSAEALVG
ncbi:acyl-CoA dehydrogenase [Pikeienuella piscinae]|uniref:3-methylmercaptopropionyl-CoA dehydrogenase n=1 Tax=Pikeienuella piscinae TaxID=2748098 RepID=A0A7M3T659_9RHOB|nr:acyl-CoA dehydrogenase [Pikeienuella piscinae]QIE57490.1 acyl-CoA dehydrogenase [Pikeienuella piscinae]